MQMARAADDNQRRKVRKVHALQLLPAHIVITGVVRSRFDLSWYRGILIGYIDQVGKCAKLHDRNKVNYDHN